jgi:hypothetical protein
MEELKIKGAVIKDPRDWTREAYGKDAYKAALSALHPHERAMVDGVLYPTNWYPIATWDKFLRAMRSEAQTRAGHSPHEFNMRNMREAGSAIVRTFYRFVLGLMNARSVIERGVLVFSRSYSEGRFELLENVPGRALIGFRDADPGFRENLTHMVPTAFVFLLELNGVQEPQGKITRDDVVDGKLFFDVTLTYAA